MSRLSKLRNTGNRRPAQLLRFAALGTGFGTYLLTAGQAAAQTPAGTAAKAGASGHSSGAYTASDSYERMVLGVVFAVFILALAGTAALLRLRRHQRRAWETRDAGAPVILQAPPPLPLPTRRAYMLPLQPAPDRRPAADPDRPALNQSTPDAAALSQERPSTPEEPIPEQPKDRDHHKHSKQNEIVIHIEH